MMVVTAIHPYVHLCVCVWLPALYHHMEVPDADNPTKTRKLKDVGCPTHLFAPHPHTIDRQTGVRAGVRTYVLL